MLLEQCLMWIKIQVQNNWHLENEQGIYHKAFWLKVGHTVEEIRGFDSVNSLLVVTVLKLH